MSRRFTVEISADNFENCLLTFLRATSTIHDDEEAELIGYKNKKGVYTLDIRTRPYERQLSLPLETGDPLAR